MRELALCAYCDTVHRRVDLPARATARCVTCDAPLYRGDVDLGAMLAVSITAAVALVVANAFPLITLTAQGQQTHATLWRAIVASYDGELPLIAMVLATTLIIAPLIEIGLLLWVLVPLCIDTRPPGFAIVMRVMRALRPWRMVEVFLLGVVVAIVKLGNLATVVPGWGVFGMATMALALASLASFDRGALWHRADTVRQ